MEVTSKLVFLQNIFKLTSLSLVLLVAGSLSIHWMQIAGGRYRYRVCGLSKHYQIATLAVRSHARSTLEVIINCNYM